MAFQKCSQFKVKQALYKYGEGNIFEQLTARRTISPTKPDLVSSVTKLYSTLHLFYCYDNSLNTNIGTDSNVLSGKNKYEQMSSYISHLKKIFQFL